DALQAANVQQRAAAAGLTRLEGLIGDSEEDPGVVDRVRRRVAERTEGMWERLGGGDETPSQAYARLRVEMIQAERDELIRMRDEGLVPDDVLRQVIAAIDVEETVLYLGHSWSSADREDGQALTAPRKLRSCQHLDDAGPAPRPRTPNGCEECLAQGTTWVHLRLCLTCGHVGCCDSSRYKH